MNKCNICPRKCNIDRSNGVGFCKMSDRIYAARAALHMWEEPCISGTKGSGAVFFSGCNLRCIFCQNHEIAKGTMGKEISEDRLVQIFLELQEKGANNINLVTPSHYILQIRDALIRAKNQGLIIPVVYNSSAYEEVNALKQLDGLIDIYLPDLKYISSDLSYEYSNARDYFDVAAKAIKEMTRQCPVYSFEGNTSLEEGIMTKGVIVRHLVLPGNLEDSKAVIKYLYDTYGDSIFISIMNQYTPLETMKNHPVLNRRLSSKEYDEVVDYAIELGVNNGFIQEGDTAKESFIPDFNGEGLV